MLVCVPLFLSLATMRLSGSALHSCHGAATLAQSDGAT